MAKRKAPLPPAYAPAVGTKVDYYEVLKQKYPTIRNATVASLPRLLGGHTWVIDLKEKRGCVAFDHIKRNFGPQDGWDKFTPEPEEP